MQCPLAPNNLLSLAIGPQKLVTILDINNAAPAPSQFGVGSGSVTLSLKEPELLWKIFKHLGVD